MHKNALSRRRHVVAALAALTLGAAPAFAETVVGSGRMASESRAVAGFSAIQLEASMKVVVRQSGAESVQLRADDNLLPLIETFVETRGSQPTLVIRWKRWTSIRDSGDIAVTVEAAQVNGLSTSGSGSIEAGTVQTERLRLAVAGSGDIRIDDLKANDLDASIAGSGDLRLAGRAARVKVGVAGSGDADLSRLTADEAKVSIAGSGDVDVNADQALSVSIAGSGDVRYGGQVTAVKTSVVGSGDVRRR
jgi:hypothetical protein